MILCWGGGKRCKKRVLFWEMCKWRILCKSLCSIFLSVFHLMFSWCQGGIYWLLFCLLVFSSRLNVPFVVNQSNCQDLSFCTIMNPRDLQLKHILILSIAWEEFKYNQSGCRQLWAVHVLDAWVDARVACLLKYWSFKTPTNCSENTSHSWDSFLELGLRRAWEQSHLYGEIEYCEQSRLCQSSRYGACPKIFQSWDLKLASRSVKRTNKQTQWSVG